MSKKSAYITIFIILLLSFFAATFSIPQFNLFHFKKQFKFGLDLQGGTRLIYQADMSKVPPKDRESAMESVRDTIERRVNAFGISEARVVTNKVGDKYRLIVELPGVEIKKAMEWIGETPLLEFKEQNPLPKLSDSQKKEMADYNKQAKARAESILSEALKNPGKFGDLAKKYSEDPVLKAKSGDLGWFGKGVMSQSIEDVVFEKLKLGEIYHEVVETQTGYHIIKKTGEKDDKVRASDIFIKKKTMMDYLSAMGWTPWKYTGLTGKQLKRANIDFDPTTGEPRVALEFTKEGAKLFAKITERNIKKPLAIFLDKKSIIDTDGDGKITDKDLYAPIVQEKISSGKAVITGNMTVAEAKLLAKRLRSGALAVDIGKPIYKKTIGPTLGRDSLAKSFKAGIAGFLAIIIFLIIFYRLPGILASISLSIYSVLILFFFKIFSVTLTLAGIGGILLSVGMAVDANILIFERLKEEMAAKKPFSFCVEESFRRAWSSIRDGNVTTLIVALIMFSLGTSFIKGFALTLGIGVLTSMFSAIFVTKNFLVLTEGTRLERIRWLWR